MINADNVKMISDIILKDANDKISDPLSLLEYLFGLSYSYNKLFLASRELGIFKKDAEKPNSVNELMLEAATKDLTEDFINNLKERMEKKNG